MSNQYIRPVTEEDSRLLYEWRNEELVRKNFFNQEIIPWENHEQWFKKILASDNEYAFILVDGNDLIGQVRLTVENDVAEISYSIDVIKPIIDQINKIVEEQESIYLEGAKKAFDLPEFKSMELTGPKGSGKVIVELLLSGS